LPAACAGIYLNIRYHYYKNQVGSQADALGQEAIRAAEHNWSNFFAALVGIPGTQASRPQLTEIKGVKSFGFCLVISQENVYIYIHTKQGEIATTSLHI